MCVTLRARRNAPAVKFCEGSMGHEACCSAVATDSQWHITVADGVLYVCKQRVTQGCLPWAVRGVVDMFWGSRRTE
jgi:hypothetical protein